MPNWTNENGVSDFMSDSKTALPQTEPVALPMVDGGFGTIFADCPWRYDNTSSRGAAEDHYPTMSIHEICALPVAQIAAKNAHLYLWITDAVLEDVFRLDLFSAWGFKFKQHLCWFKVKNGKPQMGLGNYYRHTTELLLFGTRGKAPVKLHSALNFLQAPREEHSKKPDLFQWMAQDMSPAPYVELFARRDLPGWSTWGNQVGW